MAISNPVISDSIESDVSNAKTAITPFQSAAAKAKKAIQKPVLPLKETDIDPEKIKEPKRIKQAFWLAVAAIAMFVLGLLIIFTSGIIVATVLVWLAAIASGLGGFFTAKKVKRLHPGNEKYPGKSKVDFAEIIGYFTWFLGSIGVFLGIILLGFVFFF